MARNRLTRRNALKLLGASAVVGATADGVAAADSFSRVSAPSEKSIRRVVHTAEGPYATATNGDVLARRATGWERIRDAGLTIQSKSLYGADKSDDGRNFWMAGSSGVVGHYDVVDEEFTNYAQPNGLGATWYDVGASGPSGSETIYLVSSGGKVLTGTKNGISTSWGTAKTFNGGNDIYGLEVKSDTEAWFCDSAGNVYETTDGGDTWTNIGIDAAGVPLYDIAVEAADAITVVGGNGYLYEYDGASWTEYRPGSSTIRGVDRTATDQIAVGDGGVIYERDSTGWSANDLPTSKTFRDASLDTAGSYPDAVVGNAGRIYERGSYDAYPDTLRVETSVSDTIEYGFDTSGPTRKVASAESADSLTANADGGYSVSGSVGGTDTEDAYDYGGDVSGFTVTTGSASDLRTFVSGTEVSVERLSNRSWSAVTTPVTVTLYEAVEASDGLYAVGGSGRVLARNAGSWEVVVQNGPGGGANTLYGAGVTDDGENVWFGGGTGALGKLDVSTGTVTDYSRPLGDTSGWTDVAVRGNAGSETVYLTNGSGEVFRGQNDAGSVTWADPIKPGNGSSIESVTFVDSSLGYVCDGNAKLYETKDGGKTWHEIGIDAASVTLYDVAATAEDDITVVAGSGRLFRYNGSVWTPTKIGGNARYAVDRRDDRGIVAGGDSQIFEKEIDGWTETSSTTSVTLQGSLITSDPAVPKVVVGGNGTIIEQSFDDPLY